MQKIVTFLWFDGNAEEAVNFYTSLFKNSAITTKVPGPGGQVLTMGFKLEGQEFVALNGGPMFKFTEAISLYIKCDTQEEIDFFWEKLTENGGQESMCGWLKDKYGLSWQVVPPMLGELLGDKDREKAQRVIQAMMQMKKINIAALKKAYEG